MRWTRVAKYVLLTYVLQVAVVLPLVVVVDGAGGLSFEAAARLSTLAFLPFLAAAFALLAYRTPRGAPTYVAVVAAFSWVFGAANAATAGGVGTALLSLLLFAACAVAGLGMGAGLRRLASSSTQ